MQIGRIIAKIEKHRRELLKIVNALWELDVSAPTEDRQGSLEHNEKRLLVQALKRANFNQSEAARILQIGRDRLRYKMVKYGLTTAQVPKERRKGKARARASNPKRRARY